MSADNFMLVKEVTDDKFVVYYGNMSSGKTFNPKEFTNLHEAIEYAQAQQTEYGISVDSNHSKQERQVMKSKDIDDLLDEIIRNLLYATGYFDASTVERYEEVQKTTQSIKELIARERIDELKALPWKRSDRYGINSPYVTKTWLTERLNQLQGSIEDSK